MKYQFPNHHIFQFAKAPGGRAVKTRLAPALSSQQRVELHGAMTRWMCRQLCDSQLAPITLWVDGNLADPLFEDLAHTSPIQRENQRGDNLGERLAHAAATGLHRGDGVILVGSDCPFIDADYLRTALTALAQGRRAVVGPAEDGGYVLLGLTRISTALFDDIHWGQDCVFRQTRERLETLGWSYHVLPTLRDIDRPTDLTCLSDPRLPAELRQFAR